MPDFSALETIVDRSVAAMKSGDLSLLSTLCESADTAISTDGPIDSVVAQRLRSKALHNQALIAAAIKGVKAARQRAKDLAGAGQFSTYNAAGQRNQVGAAALPATRRF